MSHIILLVGGLRTDCNHPSLLQGLNGQGTDGVRWEWAYAELRTGYRPATHARLNQIIYGARPTAEAFHVVLLPCLDKDCKRKLLGKYPSPTLAPKEIDTESALATWLMSPESGLTRQKEWAGEARAGAFFCILAKLMKNKSFATDMHGHHWTQEGDLLGQAPVTSHSEIRGEAGPVVEKMKDVLLITKGGSQTKKEWAILRSRLNVAMDAFLGQSLAPLKSDPRFRSLLAYLEGGSGGIHRLDEIIAVERVRYVCQAERSKDTKPG